MFRGVFLQFRGQDYLYVNESQFGVAFGVNFVPTSNPFCVKTYAVNDISTGLFEVQPERTPLQVYPNPSQGTVQIESQDGVVLQRAELFSLDGRLIDSFELSASMEPLRIKNLASGTYWLKAIQENGRTSSAPLVIER